MTTHETMRYRYVPSRGGHAPGHLREAFARWVETGMEGTMVGEHEFHEGERPLAWLIGQLWNCTDTMPWDICDYLGLERGSTHARGVRSVAGEES